MNEIDLYGYFQSISTQNIERVEVLMSPPARYDAEGVAGIINVVLKENENVGTSGSFSVKAGYGQGEIFQASGNINYQTEKLKVYSDLLFDRISYYDITDLSTTIRNPGYVFNSETLFTEYETINMHSVRLGADYDLGAHTVVGLISDFSFRSSISDTDIHSLYSIDPGIDTLVTGKRINDNPRKFAAINFNLQHDFSQNHQFELNLDYLLFTNNQEQHYINEFFPQNGDLSLTEDLGISKINPTNYWVGKADYRLEILDKIQIEAGVKATLNTHKNEITTRRTDENTVADDQFFSFFTHLNENILSGYGSISAIFGNTSLKSGLRYEHTMTDFLNSDYLQLLYRKFGNFFPSLFIEHKLTKYVKTNISFTSRITRPAFLQLSPSPTFFDPRIFKNGNTFLLPTYTQSILSTWVYHNLTCSFEYHQIRDDIWMQPRKMGSSDQILITPINFDRTQLIGVNFSIPIIVSDWWEMNTNLGFFDKRVESGFFSESQKLSNKYFNVTSLHRFSLVNDFSLELQGFCTSSDIVGLTRREPMGAISVGVMKEFGGKGGSISLNISDILKTQSWRSQNIVTEDHLIYNRSKYKSFRRIGITYTNTFGNSKIKSGSKRKGGAEEELKRL